MGAIHFAVIYPRIGQSDNFQAPQEDEAQHVAVEVLSKRVLHRYLMALGFENNDTGVYFAADHLEEFKGGIIEFLEDEKYLYIITPQDQEVDG